MGASTSLVQAVPALSPVVVAILKLVTGEINERNATHEAIKRHEEQMRQQQAAVLEAERRFREEREALLAEQRRREEQEHQRWEEMLRKFLEEQDKRSAEIMRRADEAERRAKEDRMYVEAMQQRIADDERLRNEAETERLNREQARLRREIDEQLAAERADVEAKLVEQSRRAERETALLEAERKEMERRLMAGIQPEEWPTPEERANAERVLMQPPGDYFHCAVAGMAGTGKSSLINALRGLKNSDKSPLTARTGETETTLEIGRYQHPSTEQPLCRFVWYDIPGAGTMKVSGWQYFNKQGLFVFDLIVVVVGDRLTQLDITILEHCQRYKIPSFIVRSKANQYINNCMTNSFNWDSDDDERDFNEVYQQARRKYTEGTRRNFRETLREQNLDANSKIYIVSNTALFALIKGKHAAMKKWNQCIDEAAFVEDLSRTIKARRLAKPNENGVMSC